MTLTIPAARTPRRYTLAEVTAMARRLQAAEDLERARQVVREAARYELATQQHRDLLAAAERIWDMELIKNWAVIAR